MSENIIYCYSGSGNCLDMAKNIAKELGDTDIVMMRSFPAKTDATEAKRVGFILLRRRTSRQCRELCQVHTYRHRRIQVCYRAVCRLYGQRSA